MTFFKGRQLCLSILGASHAPRIEFCLRGLPDAFKVDEKKLAAFMERRAPGRDKLSTSRRECDLVHWTGPGCGYILNEDIRSGDYGGRAVPRPGHADFPQFVRYGRIPTGGGANSGRLTAAYCAAGGMCLQLLEKRGISVNAKIVRCGDAERARNEGDSVGGVIECEVCGVPVGLGGAMFDGLDGDISRAIFGIPGVKGVEFGNGFSACDLKGSENNDAFVVENGDVRTRTNNHGGILGGFSSGMPIVFRVAMKPTPTVFIEQDSVDLSTMEPTKLVMKGRHDPCIARRAVPVVEAMAAFAVADVLLCQENSLPRVCLTLTGRTIAEDIAQYRSQKLFTDMVELRVDLLESNEIDVAAEFPKKVPVPVLLTCRRKSDGGAWIGGEKSRAALLKKLLSAGDFAYVDLESDFHLCDKFVKNARIVRSIHCFDGKIPDLVVKDGEIPKIAVKGKDISTGVRLLRKYSCDWGDKVVMAMGYEGFFTRALSRYSHSKWVYTSVGGLSELGHVSPKEMVRDFRIRDMAATGVGAELYGVIGWPLERTRSPELHNAAFFAEDKSALMIPLPCPDVRKVLKAMKLLDMRGLAVTIPHKESIIPFLDGIDAVAKAVGAVNTVMRDEDGRLFGYNTDVAGFTRALVEFVSDGLQRPGDEALNGKRVALLGNGGAAKACRCALKRLGCKVTVFDRHRSGAHRGTRFANLGLNVARDFDIIINATPVDPIPEYRFRGDEHVFDLRYVPDVTDLMKRAARAGCRVSNGFNMLRYQAEEQRQIWCR